MLSLLRLVLDAFGCSMLSKCFCIFVGRNATLTDFVLHLAAEQKVYFWNKVDFVNKIVAVAECENFENRVFDTFQKHPQPHHNQSVSCAALKTLSHQGRPRDLIMNGVCDTLTHWSTA